MAPINEQTSPVVSDSSTLPFLLEAFLLLAGGTDPSPCLSSHCSLLCALYGGEAKGKNGNAVLKALSLPLSAFENGIRASAGLMGGRGRPQGRPAAGETRPLLRTWSIEKDSFLKSLQNLQNLPN